VPVLGIAVAAALISSAHGLLIAAFGSTPADRLHSRLSVENPKRATDEPPASRYAHLRRDPKIV
jgi:hypothetical protein